MLVAKLPGSTYAIAATNAGPRYGSAARTRPRRPTRGASGSGAVASWAAITVIMARLNHDFGTYSGSDPSRGQTHLGCLRVGFLAWTAPMSRTLQLALVIVL